MSNLSDTSLLAYGALDLAACERELLNWFMAQPRGYAATRHVIADLMHKDLSWVCGRAKALLDAGVLESLAAVNGRHPLRLKDFSTEGDSNGPRLCIGQTGNGGTGASAVCRAGTEQARRNDLDGRVELGRADGSPQFGVAVGAAAAGVERQGSQHVALPACRRTELNGGQSGRDCGQAEKHAVAAGNLDTTSEAYRHECEIRFVANLPNDAARNKYLTRVHEKRGEAAWKRLREDAWRAMRALDRVAA